MGGGAAGGAAIAEELVVVENWATHCELNRRTFSFPNAFSHSYVTLTPIHPVSPVSMLRHRAWCVALGGRTRHRAHRRRSAQGVARRLSASRGHHRKTTGDECLPSRLRKRTSGGGSDAFGHAGECRGRATKPSPFTHGRVFRGKFTRLRAHSRAERRQKQSLRSI